MFTIISHQGNANLGHEIPLHTQGDDYNQRSILKGLGKMVIHYWWECKMMQLLWKTGSSSQSHTQNYHMTQHPFLSIRRREMKTMITQTLECRCSL